MTQGTGCSATKESVPWRSANQAPTMEALIPAEQSMSWERQKWTVNWK